MSAGATAAPEDLGLAGSGNLDALRRLRLHWQKFAEGELAHPLVPKQDALPQLELLAEMAASAIGEPEDIIALLAAYHIRIESLQAALDVRRGAATQSGPTAKPNHSTATDDELQQRLDYYYEKVRSLVLYIFNQDAPEGAARLVKALSHQADSGDEKAVPLLQSIMDSVTPDRASAIQAEVRRLEREAVR